MNFWGQRQKHIEELKEQTLTTSDNTTNILKKKKKKYDISEITYNKKSYYASNYIEPKN